MLSKLALVVISEISIPGEILNGLTTKAEIVSKSRNLSNQIISELHNRNLGDLQGKDLEFSISRAWTIELLPDKSPKMKSG
jgi:hypothetical protein